MYTAGCLVTQKPHTSATGGQFSPLSILSSGQQGTVLSLVHSVFWSAGNSSLPCPFCLQVSREQFSPLSFCFQVSRDQFSPLSFCLQVSREQFSSLSILSSGQQGTVLPLVHSVFRSVGISFLPCPDRLQVSRDQFSPLSSSSSGQQGSVLTQPPVCRSIKSEAKSFIGRRRSGGAVFLGHLMDILCLIWLPVLLPKRRCRFSYSLSSSETSLLMRCCLLLA